MRKYFSEVTTVDSDDESESEPDNDDDETITDWDQSLIDNFDVDLDSMIAYISATIASRLPGVTVDHLSKVWRINANTSKITLDVTNQPLCPTIMPLAITCFVTSELTSISL